ncbi:MAG: hypothetical protein ACYDBJ_09920 [Aggregatilineales bacterium]
MTPDVQAGLQAMDVRASTRFGWVGKREDKTMGGEKVPLSAREKQVIYHLVNIRLPSRTIVTRMGISTSYVYGLLLCLKQRRGQVDFSALEAEWRAAGMFPEGEP